MQVVPAALAAAADADATAFVITAGPSARTSAKPSSGGGGGLFSFGGGSQKGPQGAGRAVQIAEQAGVGRYFVIRGAGLDASAPPSAAPGLVVAEAGSVDPILAGQVMIGAIGSRQRCSESIMMHFEGERRVGMGGGGTAQIAEQAGVGRYFVIRGAGLDASAPPIAAPGLIVAEAGSVDPTLAGQVGIELNALP